MNVLLIGGTGHVGSRLAWQLNEQSVPVTVATRNPHLIQRWLPSIGVVEITDIQQTDWHRIIPAFTHVVHLVSPRERECNQFPDEAERVVVQGAALVGRAICESKSRVVYLSTTQVYGAHPTGLITESSETEPSNVYAAVHLNAEKTLWDTCGDSLTVARLSNTLGLPVNPNIDTWDLLVHDLVREAVTKGTLTLRTSGLQHRSFVALSEAVAGLAEILGEELRGKVINVASPHSMSVRSMAQLIREVFKSTTGKDAPIYFPEASIHQTENPFQVESRIMAERGIRFGSPQEIREEIRRIILHLWISQ